MSFPAINYATNAAISYLKTGVIADYLKKLSGEPNMGYLDSRLNIDIQTIDYLEAEIKQFWHGAKPTLQTEYFEYLREALEAFNSWNTSTVWEKINTRNETVYREFELEIEEKVKTFQAHPNYKMDHLQKYEVDYSDFNLTIWKSVPGKKTFTYHRFYVIEKGADIVDTSYIPQYIKLSQQVTEKYLNLVTYYLRLWDEGKIKSDPVYLLSNLPPETKGQKLIKSPERGDLSNKLNAAITLEQLLFLFKILYESGLFKADSNKEICQFISDNFSTPKAVNISVESLQKNWTDFNKKIPPYWFALFNELAEKVKKEYPNNYRPIK